MTDESTGSNAPDDERPRGGPGGHKNIVDIPLADELGIEDLSDPIHGARGRLFSAAGRQSPVAEFTSQFLILHPPQKPFSETGPMEEISIQTDKRGVLLDELGRPKYISGAKYNGNQLWYMGERKRGTLRHYSGWFDQHDDAHKLYVNNEPLTTDIIYRLRNKTHDGEINIFPDIKSD